MISLWGFFWLAHVLGMTPGVWWGFPMVLTGIVCTLVEITTYLWLLLREPPIVRRRRRWRY